MHVCTVKMSSNTFAYITSDLISKFGRPSGAAHTEITSLRLGRQGSRGRIRVIEELHQLQSLECLDLSSNAIEKIENLDTLGPRLQELHLASNCIRGLTGLSKLNVLQVLDVDSNNIAHLPRSLSALSALRTLRCRNNELEILREVQVLQPLANLSSLALAGNPLTEVTHWRQWVIYQLPGLDILDGEAVAMKTRQEAVARFDREEIQMLRSKAAESTAKCDTLTDQVGLCNSQILQLEGRLTCAELQGEHWNQLAAAAAEELQVSNESLRHYTTDLGSARDRVCMLEQQIDFHRIEGCEVGTNEHQELAELEESVLLLSNELVGVRHEIAAVKQKLQTAHAHGLIEFGNVPVKISVPQLTAAVTHAADGHCQNRQHTVNEINTFLDERTPFYKFAQWLTGDSCRHFREYDVNHNGVIDRAELEQAIGAYVALLEGDRSDDARRERHKLAQAAALSDAGASVPDQLGADEPGHSGAKPELAEESEVACERGLEVGLNDELKVLQEREATLCTEMVEVRTALRSQPNGMQEDALWDGCEELAAAVKAKLIDVMVPETAMGTCSEWLHSMAEHVQRSSGVVTMQRSIDPPVESDNCSTVLKQLLEHTIKLMPHSTCSWGADSGVVRLRQTLMGLVEQLALQNREQHRQLVAIAANEAPSPLNCHKVEQDLEALGQAVDHFAELANQQHEKDHNSATIELHELHKHISDAMAMRDALQEELHLLKNECDVAESQLTNSDHLENEGGEQLSASTRDSEQLEATRTEEDLEAANKQIEMLLLRERDRCFCSNE